MLLLSYFMYFYINFLIFLACTFIITKRLFLKAKKIAFLGYAYSVLQKHFGLFNLYKMTDTCPFQSLGRNPSNRFTWSYVFVKSATVNHHNCRHLIPLKLPPSHPCMLSGQRHLGEVELGMHLCDSQPSSCS